MHKILKKLFSSRLEGEEPVSVTKSEEAAEGQETESAQGEAGAGDPPDTVAETSDVEDGNRNEPRPAGDALPDGDVTAVTPGIETMYAAEESVQTTPLEPLPEHLEADPVSGSKGSPPPTIKAEPCLQVAQRTHVGAARQRNEDAVYTFVAQAGGGFEPLPPLGLFIVADGMGGHYDGHKASKIVSRAVAQHVLHTLYFPLLRGDESIARQPVQEVMEDAVQKANRAIQLPDADKAMGTTLTAVLILGNRLFLVHVGDSRAYLFSEDKLGSVTTDHSIVQALQDAGQLTAEQAAEHPNRNLLYRALIGDELEQVDTFTQALPHKGLIVLCSDGLWGLVSESDMAQILSQQDSLQEKADQLVKKALEAGGPDNITVILVDFVL